MSEHAGDEKPGDLGCGCSCCKGRNDELAMFAELVGVAATVLEWSATSAALTGLARAVATVASVAAMFARRSR